MKAKLDRLLPLVGNNPRQPCEYFVYACFIRWADRMLGRTEFYSGICAEAVHASVWGPMTYEKFVYTAVGTDIPVLG